MRHLVSCLALIGAAFFLHTAAIGGDKKGGEPRDAIAAQLELIKAGKTDELKAWFTDRLKSKITAEEVTKAQKVALKFTVDDLVGDVQRSSFMGKETAKIKMKGGKTLTTLILTDGTWLADTIWFR